MLILIFTIILVSQWAHNKNKITQIKMEYTKALNRKHKDYQDLSDDMLKIIDEKYELKRRCNRLELLINQKWSWHINERRKFMRFDTHPIMNISEKYNKGVKKEVKIGLRSLESTRLCSFDRVEYSICKDGSLHEESRNRV